MGTCKGLWQWRQHSHNHCEPQWCFISALIQRRNTHSHLHSKGYSWKYKKLYVQCKRNRYELMFDICVTWTDRAWKWIRMCNINYAVAKYSAYFAKVWSKILFLLLLNLFLRLFLVLLVLFLLFLLFFLFLLFLLFLFLFLFLMLRVRLRLESGR